MEAQENPTYLHVNPYCNDRQVIHIESILGSNVVILGIFSCKNDSSSNKVEVEKIEFEIYPMDGLFSWGFKKIIPQLDSDVKNNKIREGYYIKTYNEKLKEDFLSGSNKDINYNEKVFILEEKIKKIHDK